MKATKKKANKQYQLPTMEPCDRNSLTVMIEIPLPEEVTPHFAVIKEKLRVQGLLEAVQEVVYESLLPPLRPNEQPSVDCF